MTVRPGPEECVWRQKFERLAQELDDIKIRIKNGDFEATRKRAWDACPTLYVSFCLDACDSEDTAISLFGKGNYDVYKLVRTGRNPYEEEKT